MRFDSGFTTVEIIVVLTVATLIMAIAGPPLARIQKQVHLRQAVDNMAASHSLARDRHPERVHRRAPHRSLG